jgi:hypothetical protein
MGRSLVQVFILLCSSWLGYSQGTTCATVKIQIVQELTLERQGFDAHMRIHNGLDLPLEAVDVDVLSSRRQGLPVIFKPSPFLLFLLPLSGYLK